MARKTEAGTPSADARDASVAAAVVGGRRRAGQPLTRLGYLLGSVNEVHGIT